MAALSQDTQIKVNGGPALAVRSYPIANGQQLYVGSRVALNSSGYLVPFSGAAGQKLLGIVLDTEKQHESQTRLKGDTGLSPVPEATVYIGEFIQEKIAVTGVAAITDVGKVVFLNDDDNTLTLTRPTRGSVYGIISRWYSSTTCDILVFSQATRDSAAGQTDLLYLGSFDCDTITAADIRTGIPMPFRGKIIDVFAMIDIAPTGGGGTALINLEIDGTNVTGGVVTVATGDAKAAKKSGTSVTGNNTFNEGSLLDVEASTVTDMTAGRFDLFAKVERLVGI